MTGLFNRGGKAVSLAHHRTFSTRSQRNPRLISKKIFPYFLIPLETCHYWVSYYDADGNADSDCSEFKSSYYC